MSPRGAIGPEMTRLIEGLGFEIVLVSAAAARRIEPSYAQCGKRDYPAGLSFCNCFALLCFAYEVAPERDCPLLYFGKGFARNDVRSALSVA